MIGFLIGVLLVICVALFAAYRFKHVECEELKQSRANDFMQFNLTKEELLQALNEVETLKSSNQELQGDIKRLSEQGNEVKETGYLYKTRHHKRATPDVYQAVFELTTNGQRVLQSLVAQYGGNAYTSDQNGGERETCRRLGQAEVINFINYQIYKANNPHLFLEQVIENE